MQLIDLFALAGSFILLALIRRDALRKRLLLILSVLFLFRLQPVVPIRNFDFWFPLLTIGITFIAWRISGGRVEKTSLLDFAIILGTILFVAATRFLDLDGLLTRARPPQFTVVLIALGAGGMFIALYGLLARNQARFALSAGIFLLLGSLIVLKVPALSLRGSMVLRLISGQSAENAAVTDLRWLGFSYIAFRLLSVLIDTLGIYAQSIDAQSVNDQGTKSKIIHHRWIWRSSRSTLAGMIAPASGIVNKQNDTFDARSIGTRSGHAHPKLPAEYGPGDFLTYVIFPPALSAGPIDRPEHFLKELNSPQGHADVPANFLPGMERIAAGLFKKFILADSLAKMALSPANALQLQDGIWAWAALFFYGFQLYFDFSGYSDIAVGSARLIGIVLPENFRRPYLKPDIAKFWNNWHITLTQWIRGYVFNPLTRHLRSLKRSRKDPALPQWLVILITQLVTMLLIGLWHGGTLNFALWGLWHACGLFLHQQYERFTKGWLFELSETAPVLHRLYSVFSTLLTILFVMTGWVWFALPDFDSAIRFFAKLF